MLRNLFSKGAGATETEAEPSSEGPAASESRAYTVGWLLNVEGASVIWDTPRPVRIESQSKDPRSVGQRSEEDTSELQSLMRISYAVFCLQNNTVCLKTITTEITKRNTDMTNTTYTAYTRCYK